MEYLISIFVIVFISFFFRFVRKNNGQIKEKDLKITNLNGQIKENDLKITNLNGQINEKDLNITNLIGQIKEKDLKITNLNSQINEKDLKITNLNGQIKEKDLKITNLNGQINEKDLNITNLNVQIKEKDLNITNLIGQIKEKDLKITNLNSQINEKDLNLTNLKGQINENSININNLVVKINEKEGNIINLNYQIVEKVKEMINLKDRDSKKDFMIQNSKIEIEELKKEIENLTKKLHCYIDKNEIPKDSVTEYDIIVDIPSVDYFSQLDKSWIVYLSNILKDKMENSNYFDPQRPLGSLLSEYSKYSTLACLGSFNIGKTFFINKYNGSYLPSGTRSQTIGLSLSISRDNETITIDTAGSNTALQVGEDKTEEQLARKESTEMFIRDMAFSLASIIIYVLNELTWTDQRFILALQSKIQSLRSEQNIRKTLIIVHNYQKVNSYEELLAETKTYIDSPFSGTYHHGDIKKITSKEEVVLFFTESVNDTHHYFLCNDKSDFGKRYNELTIERIRTYKNYNDNLDLDKVLLEGLQNNMVSYCKSPKKLKITQYNTSNHFRDVQTKGGEIDSNNNNNGPDEADKSLISKPLFGSSHNSQLLKDVCILHSAAQPRKSIIKQTLAFTISPETDSNRENDYKLIVNKIEFIGLKMVFSSGFKPMYDIVKVKDQLNILIEAPQIEKEDIEYDIKCIDNHQWYLNIKGIKKLKYDLNDPTTVYPNDLTSLNPSQNQRRDGSFEFSIPIPINYNPTEPNFILEKGVVSFTFKMFEIKKFK
ncbi:hypothetical protein RB653_001334 [Dictyostelium firmibasis]|uniref:SHSP domain-containing protein n=1 Tax=Dictyostelium firmibasis TaxID=79012 RepID=A0AAN7U402_9MYCE